MDSYFNQLMEIQNSTDHSFFLLDQDSEPRFVIEADKRTIIIPAEFQFLGVKTDQRSEKIYFEVDRVFDDVDLSTKTCVIQYINAGTDDIDEGIYPVTELDTTTVPGKIVFKWEVDNIVCKYAGVVAFSVRFYEIDPETKLYTYCWNTIPESLPVLDGLNVSGSVTEDFPTELLEWNARMAALNTEITNKISAADATMKADLKTAKGYMDGAQAARGGAEEAESRVKKIVAGNEAYTKVESDTMYAKSQVKESERGTSVEVYPEDGSNLAVTAYGFTEQAGTGDPSPTNVREIINGGLKLVEVVLTGTEGWVLNPHSGTAASGSRRFQLGMSVTSSNASAYVVAVAYCSHFDGTTPANTYGSNYDNTFSVQNADLQLRVAGISAVDDLKRFLAARYAAGDPVIVWYVPADEADATGLYAPIILTSGEYRATCLPLTAPLCEGDSVVSWVKSGCDRTFTFDGSEDENWELETLSGSVNRYWIQLDSNIAQADTSYGFALSNWLTIAVTGGTGNASLQNVFTITADQRLYVRTTNETLDEFKNKIRTNPIFICCRSVLYSEKNDIPISLEKHVRWCRVLNGTESYYEYRKEDNTETYFGFSTGLRPYSPSTDGNNGVSSHFKFGGATSQGYYPNCFVTHSNGDLYIRTEIEGVVSPETMKSYAKSQFDNGTPLTFVYKLAAILTYAHKAVYINSNINESDKIIVSGQKEISVSYHKSLDKTIVELDNKAYSKQESDNIFAKALRGTSEAAKSISIHPDAGSNVIVTAHGFTKQEGESDASPVNIRKIVTGGSRVNLFKQVINKKVGTLDVFTNRGTITINGTGSSSSTAADYVNAAFELSAGKYSVSVIANKLTNGSEQPSFRIHYINSDGNNVLLGYVTWDKTIHEKTIDHPGGKLFFGIYTPNATFDNITVKVMLVPGETADKNFIPTVSTEYGIGIITSGDVKTEIASELIAPLCQGDTFITKMKSECDNMIVVDGKNKKVVDGGSTYFNVPIGNYGGVAGSIVYKNYGGGIYNSGSNLQLNRTDFGVYGNTPDEFNKYCQKNPLILWYKTPSYTEAKDMKISVERHSHALIKMNGTEGITIYWNGHKDEQLENGRVTFSWPMPYPYKTADSSGSKVSHFTNRSDITSGRAPGVGYYFAATRNIYICIDLNTINAVGETDDTNLRNKILQYLSQQYALGTPVTIEYQMNNSLTFAHDAIDLIANPDEEGALVITGESNGTVSAEYNKDITYAFSELQSAVLALGAKLSL